MTRVFWNLLPADIALDVATLPDHPRQHEPYPSRHRYEAVDWCGNESSLAVNMPGLLVGGTPVADAEGLHYPLQFLAPRLRHFHEAGQPVDVVGVGVDCSLQDAGRKLFDEIFLPVRSWTVRSASCRHALISYGVPESRIRVGADFAWLHHPRTDLREMAEALWKRVGVDSTRPLIVVNIVNMHWGAQTDRKRAIAAALDRVSEELNLQVAFFCNESRSGEFFDHAAANEVAGLMQRPAIVVPNEYYSPDEAIALLTCATVTLGQRYHFTIESVLAGTIPVAILRGDKMRGLVSELPIPVAGSMEECDQETIAGTIERALENRTGILEKIQGARANLAARARENLSFLRTLPPYADGAW